MRTALAGMAIVFVLGGTVFADGWKDLAGRPCPPFSAAEWMNTDGEPPTVESLRGSVWILEFSGAA